MRVLVCVVCWCVCVCWCVHVLVCVVCWCVFVRVLVCVHVLVCVCVGVCLCVCWCVHVLVCVRVHVFVSVTDHAHDVTCQLTHLCVLCSNTGRSRSVAVINANVTTNVSFVPISGIGEGPCVLRGTRYDW